MTCYTDAPITFAGPNTYRHCKKYVCEILLVSDQEILQAMFHLHKHGLMVEPSGAAAFAALYYGKVPDAQGKKVVVVITGGNVTPEELAEHKTILERSAAGQSWLLGKYGQDTSTNRGTFFCQRDY